MNRRIVARGCVAAGFLCIIVVLAGLPGHHVGALGLSTCASGALAIGGGLAYLRTAVSRRGMSGNDRAAWGSARTLADLGELMARWLEGGIGQQPGYRGPSDIEDPALGALAGPAQPGRVRDHGQPGRVRRPRLRRRPLAAARGGRGVRQQAGSRRNWGMRRRQARLIFILPSPGRGCPGGATATAGVRHRDPTRGRGAPHRVRRPASPPPHPRRLTSATASAIPTP